jgi:TRAP-type uncharacterized transport system fused permease subunit
MFAYDDSLLLVGDPSKILVTVLTACLGVWCLASTGEGYFFHSMNWYERVIAGLAAILLLFPSGMLSIIGAIFMALLIFIQLRKRRSNGLKNLKI